MVTILCAGPPVDGLRSLQRLAELFGAESRIFDIGDRADADFPAEEDRHLLPSAVVLDAATLGARYSSNQAERLRQHVFASTPHVLVLVRDCAETTHRFVNSLLARRIELVDLVPSPVAVAFDVGGKELSRELAGHTFPRAPTRAVGLAPSAEFPCSVVMSLDSSPNAIHGSLGETEVMVWGACELLDVNKPLASEYQFESVLDQCIPFVMFLRAALGEHCWHSPAAYADLIIDDPMLRRRYGHIDFRRVLSSADNNGYHVSVAFIPWNWWRTRRSDADIFRQFQRCFSVVVHGCDHTRNEFGATDLVDLRRRAVLALERMQKLQRRTGIESHPIMVFPQERYTLEAMRALAESGGFLAVANTACIPRDLAVPSVCAADLLLPVQDAFYGLPVLKRHYPGQMAGFALGLFLGKPAIIAAHHELYSAGTNAIERLVDELSAVRLGIRWTSTLKIAQSVHLRRRVSADRYEIRFFGSRFEVLETDDAVTSYRAIRRLSASVPVSSVVVNGRSVPFRRCNDFLEFEMDIDESRCTLVQVQSPAGASTRTGSLDLSYEFTVALRRLSSEFRDNVIARSDSLLEIAKKITRAAKLAS